MKKLGTSVIALGAVAFVVAIAQEWKIEPTAVILVLAGNSVRKGSRKGAIVALATCVLMVLIAVVAATYMARGYQEVRVWQGSIAIFLGTWAFVNTVFLARACPAPLTEQGAQATPNEGRPVLQFGVRSMLWLMFALALVLGLYKWSAQRNAPPACATVQAIESRYSQQLARLRDAALGNVPTCVNDPTNMKMFAPHEIVSVEFGGGSAGAEEPHCMMRLKDHVADQRTSSTVCFKPSSGIERPVTYVRYDRFADGTSRPVAVYENQVIGKDGRTRVLYRMELDVGCLQSIAGKENSANAGQP